jgi:hypothetical protein
MRKILPAILAFAIGSVVFASPSAAESTPAKTTACRARAGGLLPDPSCTPGVASSFVTQDNIGGTICLRGYTKTVRPRASYTSALKNTQIKQNGYADTKPADYEEDHLISLELGGAPSDPRNLWPERGASPNPKDRVENRLHAEVCARQITLADAQNIISTDWRKG